MINKQPLFLAFLLIGLTLTPSHLFAQSSTLEQLRAKFKNAYIYHGEFQHVFIDSYTERKEEREGTLWIGDREYKITATNQTVVVNDGLSKVYDKNRNRVIVSEYNPREDDFAPSKFLTSTDSLYEIANHSVQKDTIKITLQSIDPLSVFKQIEISLNKSLLPLRIRATDQANNKVVTTFSDGSFLRDPTDIFNLEYPENVKIIDMRNN